MNIKFHKYHALGNDYIVLPLPMTGNISLHHDLIVRICQRHMGVGSDGILLGPIMPGTPDFQKLAEQAVNHNSEAVAELEQCLCGVRIFNPDGTEAEKSGNGLRIFCRYLYDEKVAGLDRFKILTIGGTVTCNVAQAGARVRIEMGQVSFLADRVPVKNFEGEVIDAIIDAAGQKLRFSAATIGNPHCVVICDNVSQEKVCQIGPALETHPAFPSRTNVQIMNIQDRKNLKIEIWERGAGYTLASGSSACACAAIARRMNLCDKRVKVHMPGGALDIEIDANYRVTMQGAVTAVARGEILSDIVED